MYYKILFTIKLFQPLVIEETHENATGVVAAVGVKDDNISYALTSAITLVFDKLKKKSINSEAPGLIEQAEISLTDHDWAEGISPKLQNIENNGVFYISGFNYFNHDDMYDDKRWWEFWKK